MEYRLVVPKKVQKDLEKIDKRFKEKILSALLSLTKNPYLGKKLSGEYKDFWSYRVWPYRIIYQILSREITVLIVKIGHRQGVY